jgi:ABC-type uncharacterized transport system ATPase component
VNETKEEILKRNWINNVKCQRETEKGEINVALDLLLWKSVLMSVKVIFSLLLLSCFLQNPPIFLLHHDLHTAHLDPIMSLNSETKNWAHVSKFSLGNVDHMEIIVTCYLTTIL